MAGHSQFANIKHRKEAQDKKKAKIFTKLVREIFVAARTGQPDPKYNATLYNAIVNAKSKGLSKDRIDYAIAKAVNPTQGEDYQEITYEGFAPNGVGLIIEALSDNKNRTASELRSTLTKNGGNLAENGAVSFGFKRLAYFLYPAKIATEEQILEAVIEFGAEDAESSSDYHAIYGQKDDFSLLRENLVKKFGEPEEAKLIWKPLNLIEVEEGEKEKIEQLIERLEDSDDVQNIYANYT
jgi:YebC/PmpR family DNA-binding regulatory protein